MLPDLYFRITAQGNTAPAFKRTENEVKGLKAQIVGLGVASRAVFASFAGFSLAGGLYLLGRSIRGAVRDAGDLVDAADKIGISTEKLQELRFAAEQSGQSIDEMDGLMTMFTKRLGDAAQGSGELYDLLRLNGVALRDQAGEMRPVSALLGDVADLIAHAASAQDKLNVATAAFGKGGAGAVNVFAGGAAGIRAFADEAREAGLVIDDKMLRKAAEIDDAWQKIAARIGTKWHEMILGMAGEVDYLLELLRNTDLRSTDAIQRQVSTAQAARKAVLQSVLAPLSATYIGNLDAEIAPLMEELRKRANLNLKGQLLGMQKQNPFDRTLIPPSGGEGEATGNPMDLSVRSTAEAVDDLGDSIRDTLDSGREFSGTLIHGMMDGKLAAEALGSELGNLAGKLVDIGLDMIFGGSGLGTLFGGGGGMGATSGNPFSGLYADGGFLPPGKWGIAGEAGPEAIFGGRSGMTVVPGGGGRGGDMHIHIDVTGARGDRDIMTMVEAGVRSGLAQYDRALPAKIAASAADGRRR